MSPSFSFRRLGSPSSGYCHFSSWKG
jgi:hypothetical protein